MSDARENGERGKQQTDEAALSARLQRLNEGLGHARERDRPSDGPGADRATTASGYARGFRLSSELVAGVVVGAGLGWLIDRWLGISPWGLMIFLLLGFAAGVLNVMRSAGLVAGAALDDSSRSKPGQVMRRCGASCQATARTMQVDPIHQFQIENLMPMTSMGGIDIAFTNSALFMLIIVAAVSTFLIGATARRAVVPGRLQSIAEISYEFVANTVRSSAGTEGMKFFPFVFTLFMFVLFANLIGLIPYSFTVTSQLIVTATLALPCSSSSSATASGRTACTSSICSCRRACRN